MFEKIGQSAEKMVSKVGVSRRGFLGRVSKGAAVLGGALAGFAASQALAITGGEVDEDNTYSNVGALVGVPPDGSPIFVGFSGTLIHPRVLLTAGHATEFLVQNPWAIPLSRVSFGTDAFDPSTWHEVEAVITHPDYQIFGEGHPAWKNPHTNDVGVVILRKPVNTRKVPLAKLPYPGFLDDLKAAGVLRDAHQGQTSFTVVGYGATLDWPPPESILGDGLRRFAQSEYLGLTESWLFNLMNPATGNGGGDTGDSGGPNFWVQPDGTLILVAITSRGDPNDVATNICWRADIPETLDFIDWVLDEVNEGRL